MHYLILGFFALFLISCESKTRAVPILGERKVREIEGKIDTIYHTISPFEFINQYGEKITEKKFENKIYIADFFFTSCTTICPKMTQNMLSMYQKYKDNDTVYFVSHTIDTQTDTRERLKEYAHKIGVIGDKWQFLTGDENLIYKIGKESYFVTAQKDNSDPDGFLHNGAFILIDQKKRIRGVFDGTKIEQIKELEKTLDLLLLESK